MNCKEVTNRVTLLVNYTVHTAWYFLVSFVETLFLRMIGVIVGKQIQFNGWCSVFRSEGSHIEIGDNCSFNSADYTNHIGLNHRCILTTMSPQAQLFIGRNCGISSTSITSFKSITLEDNVRIGANCVIMDGDFHLEDPRVSPPQPVLIKRNVWLGYGVIVMKGVTIGENSVIAANSVVSKDIPANVVAAGSPAKPIKCIQ